MEPTISIIVPVLGRPHRVEPLLVSIAEATTGTSDPTPGAVETPTRVDDPRPTS